MPVDIARLSLVSYPDPRLRARCAPVERFDDELRRVAERMTQIMQDEKGVGLAAPQVGLPWRLIVVRAADEAPPTAYVNPVLTPGDESAMADEGCLSIPEVTVSVRRATTCVLRAMDLGGRPMTAKSNGLLARVWQHECDHLDGRMIIDVMSEAERIASRKLLRDMESKYAPKKPLKRRGGDKRR